MQYQKLSKELTEQILEDKRKNWINPYACTDDKVIRRNPKRDKANLWRPAFVRDIDKILHSPYYNRYADKTQVFSFYKNDDITRRALHVQLVSRIARNIGNVLGLNEDLIEAIALGHDIGHTPFGHAGERMINTIYHGHTGRYFNHNVHSVRVLDSLFWRNISLQTLDGIICHNGEFEQKEYRPLVLSDFEEYDKMVEACYTEEENIGMLIPSTLEGCVVRISDMIAYLGKDRQDARKANLHMDMNVFTNGEIGVENAEMTNNLTVNIIENSYGKDYIQMGNDYYQALKKAKQENFQYIYQNEQMDKEYQGKIRPMVEAVYEKLLQDAIEKNPDSYLYKHHVGLVRQQRGYYSEEEAPDYMETEPNQIVVDYMASMTDDYFVDLYHELFPKGKYKICYIPYFVSENQ